MSCIVTPKPPAPHAPCMRALASSYDSVLIRLSGHTVHPDKVCLTVSCVHTHPVQGLASPRTLDCNTCTPTQLPSNLCIGHTRSSNPGMLVS